MSVIKLSTTEWTSLLSAALMWP